LVLSERIKLKGLSLQRHILTLTALALLVVAVNRPVAANEVAGRAETLTGKVIVERAAGQETLEAGDPVFVKDRIITAPGSSAEIVFLDESRTQLAAETTLEITGYQFDSTQKIRHAFIFLTSGKARFSVRDLPEFDDRRFRVQTETAFVASRDTDFIVSYEPELPRDEVCRGGLTNAFCLEHSIVVYSLMFQDKPSLLTVNMISQVCGPHLPTPPRFITAGESARIRAGLDQIGDGGNGPSGMPGNLSE
jgi:hypothetical protein